MEHDESKELKKLREELLLIRTERDKLIEERHASADWFEQFRKSFLHYPHPVFGCDRQLNITFMNTAAEKLTDFSSSQLDGKPFLNLLDDKLVDDYRALFLSIIEGASKPQVRIIRYKNRSGWYFSAEITCQQIIGRNDEVLGCLIHLTNIDERLQQQDKFNDHTRLINEIYSNLREGLGIVDKNEKIITCNNAFAELFETTPEQMIGKTLFDFFDEEAQKIILEQTQLRKKGVVGEYELSITTSGGKKKIISVKVSPRYNTYGEYIGSLGVITDITESLSLESEVKKIAELYHLLLENANEGILLYKGEKILYANKALLEMTGYEEREIDEYSIFAFIHPDERDLLRQRYIDRLNGVENLPDSYRIRVKKKDGNYMPCETRVASIHYDGETAILHMITDITERLNAEKALKESEEKYRVLVENMQDGLYLLQENKIVYVNERGASMLGYSIGEVKEMTLADFIHKDDLTTTLEYYEKRKRGEDAPDQYEIRLLHKDGTVRYVTLHVSAAEYKGMPASLGTVKDTTELVKTVAKLNEQKFFLDTILNSMPALITFKDKLGSYRLVNKAFLKSMNVLPRDVDGKKDADFLDENNALLEMQSDKRVFSTEEPHTYETSIVNALGKRSYFLVSKVPFFNSDGEVEGIVGTSFDITARKLAEDRLKQIHHIYYHAIESAGGLPYYLNFEKNSYDYVGDRSLEIFGIRAKDLTPKMIREMPKDVFINDPSVPADLAEYGRDFLQNKVDYYKVLIRFYFEDGTIKWITDSAVPVVSDGKVVASVGIMMDVTQMKKTEMELREMNAAKDKFFSIIAHDLRNPFNSLTGLSEFMIQNIDSLDKERITKFTKNIYQSSKDIFELITNLLQWSRIQTGRIQFDPVLGSLYILSESNVNLVQAQAMKKNVTIRNNIGPDLQVYGDKNMIDLILRNLLTNAIKFSHPGSEIRLEAERQADEACISVIDRGVGMSREKIDKLFKIEEQVSEVGTANESGTGLGLILVADFIAMHMGKIDVESEAGKGTTVSFTLPLSDERFR